MPEAHIGIVGGSSFLGECALPLLAEAGYYASVLTRVTPQPSSARTQWCNVDRWLGLELETLLSLAPIWVLPPYLERLTNCKLRRIVAMSSTSRYIKAQSSDPQERALAQRLIAAEDYIQAWASQRGIDCIILRPTLIYGFGRDKNISEIARFIRRARFFPLIGDGRALRQPVHAYDVIQACMAALKPDAKTGSYNLSGGEELSYRTMVVRIFQAQGLPVRMLPIPAGLLRLGIRLLRALPRYRHLSPALVTRMSQDLVFDHSDANLQLAFSPRPFRLNDQDLPKP